MALCNDASYDWLPESFRNCVTAFKELSSSNFEATVSTSACTKEDMAQWLDEFQQRTNTKWRVRHTYPNLKGWAYRLDLVCQHSSFNKGKTSQTTKNCNCTAKLVQKVSSSTQCMQRESLNGYVELHNVHNHATHTAAALLQLPITTETRQQFMNYFDNGMCVSEAMKYHVSVLELRTDVSEALLSNASINPKYRTVRYLYDQWREENLGPKTGSAVLQMLVTLEDNSELDAVESDANLKAAIQMMLNLHNNFGSSKSGIENILKRLKHVKTSMQWETFLHTQGAGVNST